MEPQPSDREVMVYHSFNVSHPYVAINVELSVSSPDAQLVVFMKRGNKPNLTHYDWVWKVQLPANFTVEGQCCDVGGLREREWLAENRSHDLG